MRNTTREGMMEDVLKTRWIVEEVNRILVIKTVTGTVVGIVQVEAMQHIVDLHNATLEKENM
jgi:hypothetical protein